LIAAKQTNEEGAGQVQPVRMAAPPKSAGSSIQAGSAPQPPSTSVLPASEAERLSAWSLETPVLLVVGYGAIVGGFFVWWLAGVMQLLRLKHSTYPVTEAVAELFRCIAGPAGERVRLVVSDRIELPLTYSSWRPVIVLPGSLCRSEDAAALRYCLAHEWSHVERRDAWSWYLATLTQFFFFYQPLFWWLRRQLRLCQDYLADARAAEQARQAEDYAEYLVSLARRRLGAPCQAALGIGDRRSNLYRRVTMLIQNHEPLERRCRWIWSASITLATAALLGAASFVRLDAGTPADDKKEPPAKEAAKETKKDEPKKEETLQYTAVVKETDTGKPIEGATVTVRRSLLGDPEEKEPNRVIEETKHKTDAQGKYSFAIPPEQVAKRYLYIELDVEHPDYPPRKGFGYALSMIRKNEKLGGRPFFENVELRPGKPITGIIETPDGKAAAGVKLLAYSVTNKANTFEYGSFADTKTDDKGHFRLILTTPGDGVFWLLPEKYAPSTHVVNEKRGDLGTLTLKPGIVIKGKVLDDQGKPLAGVNVNADRERQEGDDDFFSRHPVGDSIRRSATSNDKGEFEMAPLPPGSYTVKPDEWVAEASKNDRKNHPVPGVFISRRTKLEEGKQAEPIEVRAVPAVTIEAQILDSKGKPTRGHEFFIFGQIDKTSWFGQGKPDANGHIVARAPHGLENTQLDLMTNEHGVLRHRIGKDGALKNQRRVDLGTLNDDVKDLQIIRYEAPIVLVKVVTKDGAKPTKPAVTAKYAPDKAQYQGLRLVTNGMESDVNFEQQEDGRFRSEQLFPDEQVTLTAHAEGYEPKSEKLALAEGAKKEIEIVLDKAAEKSAEKKAEEKPKK
jgi:beta-lactamase regulating signal transducer with metallopeptidase domain/protocatechuate 3,4-dioxygenase beta subunit